MFTYNFFFSFCDFPEKTPLFAGFCIQKKAAFRPLFVMK
ncbi:hypothetical protein BSMD_018170 [Bacillus subtilis Miyagi-4]|nr:hypothetical protein BSNT_09336 [Bacillus subtilis subsp. natto BEST195]GAK79909.1 hypothetical protein BSMD_018170 [Bacillus subtilis Miyagi-4]